MIQKLSKEQFTTLAERYEDIKAVKRAAKEFQQEDDILQVMQNRSMRIYKKARLVV